MAQTQPASPAINCHGRNIFNHNLDGDLLGIFLNPVIWNSDQLGQKVVFSFDDGPHPEYTPRILELLERYRLTGYFFVLGQKARQFPRLIEAIHRQGHVIGNHSFSHCRCYFMPAHKLNAEIHATDAEIERITGYKPIYFRPPHGRFGIGLLKILRQQGKKLLLWNLDSQDYHNFMTWERISRRCRNRLRSGAILLFHDGHANSQRTVQALGAILQQAKDRGLTTAC